MRIVNTQDAHILLDNAKEHGKQTKLKMHLFDAYFNDRRDISDQQILIQEIQSLCSGLIEPDTDEALAKSFSGTLNTGLVDGEDYRTRAVATSDLAFFLYYNGKVKTQDATR